MIEYNRFNVHFARAVAVKSLLAQATVIARRDAEIEAAVETRKPVRKMVIGRNDPCPCQSGKKYKKCCILKTPMSKIASGLRSK